MGFFSSLFYLPYTTPILCGYDKTHVRIYIFLQSLLHFFCLHDFYYIGPFEMVTVSMVSNFFKTNSNLVGMSLSKSYNRSVYVGSKTTITLMI